MNKISLDQIIKSIKNQLTHLKTNTKLLILTVIVLTILISAIALPNFNNKYEDNQEQIIQGNNDKVSKQKGETSDTAIKSNIDKNKQDFNKSQKDNDYNSQILNSKDSLPTSRTRNNVKTYKLVQNQEDAKQNDLRNIEVPNNVELKEIEGQIIRTFLDKFDINNQEDEIVYEVFDNKTNNRYVVNNPEDSLNQHIEEKSLIKGYFNKDEGFNITSINSLDSGNYTDNNETNQDVNNIETKFIHEPKPISGTEKLLVLLCQVSDIPALGTNPSWYQDRISGNSVNSLNHYFKDQSGGRFEVTDVTVHSSWINVGTFANSENKQSKFTTSMNIASKCRNQTNYNFTSYDTIIYVHNWDMGMAFATNGYYSGMKKNDIHMGDFDNYNEIFNYILAHEYGHALGLEHSYIIFLAYGVFPILRPYASPWDVMSYGYNRENYHPTGTHSYYKNLLGWIPNNAKVEVNYNTSPRTFVLGQTDQFEQINSDYLQIFNVKTSDTKKIISTETRLFAGYDVNIPYEGVFFNLRDLNSDYKYVVNLDVDDDGSFYDYGTILGVGNIIYWIDSNGKSMRFHAVRRVDKGIEMTYSHTKDTEMPTIDIPSNKINEVIRVGEKYTNNIQFAGENFGKAEIYLNDQKIQETTNLNFDLVINDLEPGDYIIDVRAYHKSQAGIHTPLKLGLVVLETNDTDLDLTKTWNEYNFALDVQKNAFVVTGQVKRVNSCNSEGQTPGYYAVLDDYEGTYDLWFLINPEETTIDYSIAYCQQVMTTIDLDHEFSFSNIPNYSKQSFSKQLLIDLYTSHHFISPLYSVSDLQEFYPDVLPKIEVIE